MLPPAELATHQTDLYNKAAYRFVVAGVLLIVLGLAVAISTWMLSPGGYQMASYGPMALGVALVVVGLRR